MHLRQLRIGAAASIFVDNVRVGTPSPLAIHNLMIAGLQFLVAISRILIVGLVIAQLTHSTALGSIASDPAIGVWIRLGIAVVPTVGLALLGIHTAFEAGSRLKPFLISIFHINRTVTAWAICQMVTVALYWAAIFAPALVERLIYFVAFMVLITASILTRRTRKKVLSAAPPL
jgi:hypothetical protein